MLLRNSTPLFLLNIIVEMLIIIFKLPFSLQSPPAGPLAPILFPAGNLALDCFNHLDIKGSAEITIMAANRRWFLHLFNTVQ